MMKYSDIDKRKKAFIFELDDVLYPEKDYLYQVYYLFANLLEYTTTTDSKKTVDIMVDTHAEKGKSLVFDALKEMLETPESYREKLEELTLTAKLPLKLLLYNKALSFLQDLVLDRKQIFIVTNNNPLLQLNKIKQTEWNGLERYLKVYFAEEKKQMPETDIIDQLMVDNSLHRKDILFIGKSPESILCASNCGIDYVDAARIFAE